HDLFGDLPSPAAPRVRPPSLRKGPLLFDDLPPSSSADSGKGGSLLFDGLPPASSGDPGKELCHSPASAQSPLLEKPRMQPVVLHTLQVNLVCIFPVQIGWQFMAICHGNLCPSCLNDDSES
uniref:Uncharacterized protein n=1 Tax=Malurus cyaneus samueli TaxID=2593467 RepID=A0A8C5THN4_9PASS